MKDLYIMYNGRKYKRVERIKIINNKEEIVADYINIWETWLPEWEEYVRKENLLERRYDWNYAKHYALMDRTNEVGHFMKTDFRLEVTNFVNGKQYESVKLANQWDPNERKEKRM